MRDNHIIAIPAEAQPPSSVRAYFDAIDQDTPEMRIARRAFLAAMVARDEDEVPGFLRRKGISG